MDHDWLSPPEMYHTLRSVVIKNLPAFARVLEAIASDFFTKLVHAYEARTRVHRRIYPSGLRRIRHSLVCLMRLCYRTIRDPGASNERRVVQTE
jgi:hypothetical protein